VTSTTVVVSAAEEVKVELSRGVVIGSSAIVIVIEEVLNFASIRKVVDINTDEIYS
jgi:hypothetical protein